MHDRLCAWALARGYRVAWGPSAAIDVVRADLASRITSGEIDAALARDQLSSFRFETPSGAGRPWTVLVVAVPRSAHRVTFIASGRRVDAIIPPTYVRYRGTFEDIREDLLATALAGTRVERADVPFKPLAARLGLVRYGRNNVTYIDGLGSYFQLAGYVTDADLRVQPDWSPAEPQLLDECDDCGICEAVCPTGAIRDERVLLHAERCLTFANENPAALPAWVPPAAHNALVGCLQCQQHCPANPPLRVDETGILFSEEETVALISAGADPLAWGDSIRNKLAPLGLTEDSVIGRNLRILLQSES